MKLLAKNFLVNFCPSLRVLFRAVQASKLLANLFRKPNLKSRNSSKTAYSCNAEFMVSFCTLMSENFCEASHFTEQV